MGELVSRVAIQHYIKLVLMLTVVMNSSCCIKMATSDDNPCTTAVSTSPPITEGGTAAILTLNNFEEGGSGGGPSKCDGVYHSNQEYIAALSTGWFDSSSRCGKKISITADNGNSVTATVVDECDSQNGCDAEHGGLPPCRNNIVDVSQAVWNDLVGANWDDNNEGEPQVTWVDA